MIRTRIWLAAAFGVIAVAVGCSGDGNVSSSGSGGSGASTPSGLPCDVAQLLVANCTNCHGSPLAGGAPMPLLSHAQLTAPSKSNPALSNAELSVQRMQDSASPMPPTGLLPAAEVAILQDWIASGSAMGDCGAGGSGAGGAPPLVCTSNSYWLLGDEGDRKMHPGLACIACHIDSGKAPTLLVGGTVYPSVREPDDCNGVQGAIVEVTDGNGVVHSYTTNQAGNFFQEVDQGIVMTPPISARVLFNGNQRAMQQQVDSPDCNSCHTQDGSDGAPGRIYLP